MRVEDKDTVSAGEAPLELEDHSFFGHNVFV
jgi:hypothetical protein